MIFLAAKKPDQNNDYITNKVLTVFTLCLVGVLGLMYLNGMLGSSSKVMLGIQILSIGKYVGLVIALIGAFLLYRERKQKLDVSNKLICGRSLIVVGILLFVMFLLLYRYAGSAFKAFYVILPAFAFMYLIYYSYQREFFVVAADCVIGAGLAYLVNTVSFSGAKGYVLLALAVVLAISQIVLVQRVKKAGGKLTVKGQEQTFKFSGNAYKMMMIGAAALAVVTAIGLFSGSVMAAVGLAAVLFVVSGVYYTVKLV